ncbi:MAG: 50S ribosomal protein L18 [Acidobacteriota bacterium]
MIKDKCKEKKRLREKRIKRIKKSIPKSQDRLRLVVFKSNKYLYIQAINDLDGNVLTSASTLEKQFRKKYQSFKNIEIAKKLGELIGERLLKKNIKKVLFDRRGYPYHGRIKAIAEGAREKGLEF